MLQSDWNNFIFSVEIERVQKIIRGRPLNTKRSLTTIYTELVNNVWIGNSGVVKTLRIIQTAS